MPRKFLAVLALGGLLALLPAGQAAAQLPVTIYQIQTGQVALETTVQVTDVVCTAPVFNGFWCQEQAGGPWSGIFVFVGSSVNLIPEIGEAVTIVGDYQEYESLSELGNVQSVTVTGTPGPPAAQLIRINEISRARAVEQDTTAERWESVLIELDADTTMIAGEDTGDEYWIWTNQGPGDTLNAWDSTIVDVGYLLGPTTRGPAGSEYTFIRGPHRNIYGERRIIPRDAADLGAQLPPVFAGAHSLGEFTINALFNQAVTQASSENLANWFLQANTTVVTGATRDASNHALVHLTTTSQVPGEPVEILAFMIEAEGSGALSGVIGSPFRAGFTPISMIQTPDSADASGMIGETVTVSGICTYPSDLLPPYNGGLYLQDAGGGPYSGMYIYSGGQAADVGDSVVYVGTVVEFGGKTEMQFGGIDYREVLTTGVGSPPVADVVGCGDIVYNDATLNSEIWESCLVKLPNVRVSNIDSSAAANGVYFMFCDATRADTAQVDQDTYMSGYDIGPGDSLDVTGVLDFQTLSYRITPRTFADIVIYESSQTGVAESGQAARAGLDLAQNRPNPFNPHTQIVFDITRGGNVKLTVHNLAGQLVRTLADQPFEAGRHELSWDGIDESGRAASSGTYFFRIETPQGSAVRKMTLLR